MFDNFVDRVSLNPIKSFPAIEREILRELAYRYVSLLCFCKDAWHPCMYCSPNEPDYFEEFMWSFLAWP